MLWDPRFFGIRPELVIKGGALVRAALGDPNASIPTPQPVLMRPDAGRRGRRATTRSPSSRRPRSRTGSPTASACAAGWPRSRPTRDVGKADMVNNSALPAIDVDPETFAITIDGDLVEPAPPTELPLAQLYSMF